VREPKALLGETSIAHRLATHTTNTYGRFPIEGRLWVTPRRLVFVPRFGIPRFHWSCDFDAISKIAIRPVDASWLNRSPKPRIAVETGGKVHFLLVHDPSPAMTVIEAAMSNT
jgi:hypothetical protein